MPEPAKPDKPTMFDNLGAWLNDKLGVKNAGTSPEQIYSDLGKKFGGDNAGQCTMSRPERSSMNHWEEGNVNRDKITPATQASMDQAVKNCPRQI